MIYLGKCRDCNEHIYLKTNDLPEICVGGSSNWTVCSSDDFAQYRLQTVFVYETAIKHRQSTSITIQYFSFEFDIMVIKLKLLQLKFLEKATFDS